MKALNTIVAMLLLLSTWCVQAEFVMTDWHDGDGLSVLDEASNKTWLNLSVTSGKSVEEVQSKLNSLYVGWRLPTRHEVVELMYHAFPNQQAAVYGIGGTSTSDRPTAEYAELFALYFGVVSVNSTRTFSRGLFLNDELGTNNQKLVLMSGVNDVFDSDDVILYSNYDFSDDIGALFFLRKSFILKDTMRFGTM